MYGDHAQCVTIEDFDAQRIEAMLNADIDTLDQLIHENIVYAHGSGLVDDKATYLAKVKNGTFNYLSGCSTINKVMALNGAVLVFIHVSMAAVLEGVPRQIENSVLTVWTESGQGWQMIAHQPTRLSGLNVVEPDGRGAHLLSVDRRKVGRPSACINR